MPMKWTADKDQLLLLKILETAPLAVDVKKIHQAWPGSEGDKPTARAITEHLVKLRKDATKAGVPGFAISSSQNKGGPRSTPATPRKPTTKTPTSTPKTSTPASKKRKIKIDSDSDDDIAVHRREIAELCLTPSASSHSSVTARHEGDVSEEPAPRQRRAASTKLNFSKMMEDSEDESGKLESGAESDISDFEREQIEA